MGVGLSSASERPARDALEGLGSGGLKADLCALLGPKSTDGVCPDRGRGWGVEIFIEHLLCSGYCFRHFKIIKWDYCA